MSARMILALILGILILPGCQQDEPQLSTEGARQDDAEDASLIVSKPTPRDMVLIPAGEFTMGTEQQASPQVAVPEHTIDLPAYYIDVYEATNGEWILFLTETDFQPEGKWNSFYSIGRENHPVINVTWEDAKTYCGWAGKRLPTESEWEKAARGPDAYRYSWGDVWDARNSNSREMGMRNTMEVGEVATDQSPYGVYDMVGNTQEWTNEKLAPYPNSPARNDDAFRSNYIAVRGGSFNVKGEAMGLYSRSGYMPDSQYGIGFRCVRDENYDPEESNRRALTEATGDGLEVGEFVKLRWPSWFTLSLKSWNESLYPALQQKDNAAIYKMFEYGVVQELPDGTWIEIQEVGSTYYVVKIRKVPDDRKERVGWQVYIPHDIVFER